MMESPFLSPESFELLYVPLHTYVHIINSRRKCGQEDQQKKAIDSHIVYHLSHPQCIWTPSYMQ